MKNINFQLILMSILLTGLTALFCGCIYTIIGLILNFWNATTLDALTGSVGALLVGTIVYFGIRTILDKLKERVL